MRVSLCDRSSKLCTEALTTCGSPPYWHFAWPSALWGALSIKKTRVDLYLKPQAEELLDKIQTRKKYLSYQKLSPLENQ